MAKKRIVMAIGHKDMGTNLPEQKAAVARTAKIIADFIQEGWQVAIVHSNAPQVGMIHTAMNEFGKQHDGYSQAPMSVCSAMSRVISDTIFRTESELNSLREAFTNL